jgi:hypothetical protein
MDATVCYKDGASVSCFVTQDPASFCWISATGRNKNSTQGIAGEDPVTLFHGK